MLNGSDSITCIRAEYLAQKLHTKIRFKITSYKNNSTNVGCVFVIKNRCPLSAGGQLECPFLVSLHFHWNESVERLSFGNFCEKKNDKRAFSSEVLCEFYKSKSHTHQIRQLESHMGFGIVPRTGSLPDVAGNLDGVI